MYPCEFDKNPLIGSFSRAQTTGYTNANAEPTDPHQKQYVLLPYTGKELSLWLFICAIFILVPS